MLFSNIKGIKKPKQVFYIYSILFMFSSLLASISALSLVFKFIFTPIVFFKKDSVKPISALVSELLLFA